MPALSGGTDVEQVVGAHLAAGTEIFNEGRQRLVIKIPIAKFPSVH